MALPSFGGAAGSILTGLTAVAMLSLQLAYAHGPAEWIQRGGFKNAAGELCCGERDCFELTDADVKITSAGYYVVSIKETRSRSARQRPRRTDATGDANGAARGSVSSHHPAPPERRRPRKKARPM